MELLMKRAFVLFLSVWLVGWASILEESLQSQKKFFYDLFSALFSKRYVRVYIANKRYRKIFEDPHYFIVEYKCQRSDLVIGFSKECTKTYHFVFSYEDFKKDPLAFGAFYWKKGRPQLIFRRTLVVKINPKAVQWLQKYFDF